MARILKQGFFVLILMNWVTVARAQRISAILDFSDSTKLRHYYKLADGREVGEDSVYVFDATDDCESDGKIRFHDRVTDKVGFFDNKGKVVIPAVYNDASPFRNGMARAIRNAKRVGWNGEDCEKGNCEHWSWAGGSTMLINARNEVLVDSFGLDRAVNWHSMQLKEMPGDTDMYCSVKGVNGKYYVFLDYQKEFDRWFQEEYLAASPDAAKLREFVHDSLVSSLHENEEWVRMSGDEFIQKCGSRLTARMQPIRHHQISIFTGLTMFGMNPYIHTGPSFERFFDGCIPGDAGRYPAFDVISNFLDKNGRIDYQEQYSFLRTDKGYKLIGVSWHNP